MESTNEKKHLEVSEIQLAYRSKVKASMSAPTPSTKPRGGWKSLLVITLKSAAGFVGYGSAGGVRAVENLRLVMGEIQVADVRAQVIGQLPVQHYLYARQVQALLRDGDGVQVERGAEDRPRGRLLRRGQRPVGPQHVEELRDHESKYDAMRKAWKATLEPILASGATVILGLMCLLLSDLAWLRETGLADAVAAHAARGGAVLGICGGFQMLGRRIEDPDGIEGPPGAASQR